ncbi:MAG: DUF3108 domain-containing protein [Sulfurovum sp.]|nr:DUF3108 domain-containing protein [Sulfurovum sp.]
MLKAIITVLGLMALLPFGGYAKTLHAEYKVSYGIVGKIGVAQAILKTEGNHYHIDIALAATGLAKTLSGNRTERHISKGHIVNGMLVCDTYEVIRRYRKTKVVKTYTIEHKKHRVQKYYRKYKSGKLADEQRQILDFYATNDLLTLYFNLDRLIPDKNKAGTYVFNAVGAEKQKGKVDIVIPSSGQLPQYREELGAKAEWYATVVIHQKIFMSKEGRLQIAVGKDGITQTALLKDLILFGDIKAERVR